MAPDESYDVFLSHAHPEADVVEKLGVRLEDEANLRVWLDRWSLIPGEHWQQEMAKGLDQAKSCAVCIGKHTPAGWFQEEIEKALNRQTRDKYFRVIPVILPQGDRSIVADFLELRTWVDFANGIDDAYAFHILVSGVRGVRPGRNPYYQERNDADLVTVREKLARIRHLREEQLVDDDIALEFQRRLLDRLIEP